jgi:simple sugar transport system permease protein
VDLKERLGLSNFVHSLAAVLLALLVGAVLILVSGHDIFRAYLSLLGGAFGGSYQFAQTLVRMIPLLFTGLAVAIGFRSGLFNIGGEGQLYWGAFATAAVSLAFPNLNPVLLIPFCLIGGVAAGGLWGMIPGYLKAKTGAHEVVTTIMMNTIGILATTFLLRNCCREPGPVDQSPTIPASARMAELIAGTGLTWALFLGIALVVAVDFLFRRTSLGYDLQAVGDNAAAAEYAGIHPGKIMVSAMFLSGAAAGLAGSTMVLGVLHRFIPQFSPGYGFVGIAVALLGRNNPWGVLLAAFLFGALDAGGISMQLFARIPMDLMTVLQGLVILFVAAPSLVHAFTRSRRGI